MDLKDLMAVGGHPGLFRFVSQGRNAIIVESLDSGKRMSAYPAQKISTLEEIAVFTAHGELSLAEVFVKIWKHTGGSGAISHKSPDNEIRKLFDLVLPEYDRDRVYVSDMKKILSWYNLLVGMDIINAGSVKDDKGEEAGSQGSGAENKGAKGKPGGKESKERTADKESKEMPESKGPAAKSKSALPAKGAPGKAGVTGKPEIKSKPVRSVKSVRETPVRKTGKGS